MAVDSEAKRSSVVNLVLPWYSTLPPPDGSVSQADRQHVGQSYTGILATLPYATRSASWRGLWGFAAQRSASHRGLWGFAAQRSASHRGLWRLENTSLTGYCIWIGQDESPDLTTDPDYTTASLPYTIADALAAGHTYHVVVRARNRYGLLSQNSNEYLLELDSEGEEVPTRPSGPAQVLCEATSNGAVRVRAVYNGAADGDARATDWLIYQATGGAAPDPETDTPVTVSMRGALVPVLDWTSDTFGDGVIVRTLVRTRRVSASGNFDSRNTTDHLVVTDVVSLTTPAGEAFYPGVAEIEQ